MKALKFLSDNGFIFNKKVWDNNNGVEFRNTRTGVWSCWINDKYKYTEHSLKLIVARYIKDNNIDYPFDGSNSMLTYFVKMGFKKISTTRHALPTAGIYVQKYGNDYHVRRFKTDENLFTGMRNELKEYLKREYNLCEEEK